MSPFIRRTATGDRGCWNILQCFRESLVVFLCVFRRLSRSLSGVFRRSFFLSFRIFREKSGVFPTIFREFLGGIFCSNLQWLQITLQDTEDKERFLYKIAHKGENK